MGHLIAGLPHRHCRRACRRPSAAIEAAQRVGILEHQSGYPLSLDFVHTAIAAEIARASRRLNLAGPSGAAGFANAATAVEVAIVADSAESVDPIERKTFANDRFH